MGSYRDIRIALSFLAGWSRKYVAPGGGLERILKSVEVEYWRGTRSVAYLEIEDAQEIAQAWNSDVFAG
jgi:hypothetical protein